MALYIDRSLRALYVGAVFLAMFMVLWILVLPASWRQGNFSGWEGKYSGHRLVQFTHILPGAVWATAICFQLHPGFRKAHRQWHRRTGYACLSSAVLMAFGFFVLEYRQLDWMHQEFKDIPIDEATSGLGLGWIPALTFLRGVAVLWMLFAGLALHAIAIQRDFVSHRKWILRHIGMGLWIAPQRLYLIAKSPWALTLREKKEVFTDGIYVGLAITVVGAELAVWMYARRMAEEVAQRTAEEVAVAEGQYRKIAS